MACFIVTVSITYRRQGASGAGTTISRTSSCLSAPFSTELDRAADGFFLNYNGGREKLESGWTGYDLLASSITSQVSCTGCSESNTQYDCVNGGCVLKTKYNTPGLYQSLAECQLACGAGCSGKCISNDDWSQIEGLAGQLRNKNCT